MNNNILFGGKIIVLAGDFRQTCPVIPNGSKAQVIDASIKLSPLWRSFHIERLTTPIRNAGDIEFARFIDSIGDGNENEVSLDYLDPVHNAQQLQQFVFPPNILTTPDECLNRAILAPTNRQINQYNRSVLSQVQGEQRTYYAADSLQEHDDIINHFQPPLPTQHPTSLRQQHYHNLLQHQSNARHQIVSNTRNESDARNVANDQSLNERGDDTNDHNNLPNPTDILDYVAKTTPKGMPPHALTIKVNGVYRLLRNFSVEHGLVKNTRVLIIALGNSLITVRQLSSPQHSPSNQELLIPRIHFTEKLHSGHTLLRKQFPLAAAYATTFHSCQGLTLDRVGIDLTIPVFAHGQLYTALSRIRTRYHAKVLMPPNAQTTTNVVYKEILV
jgi:hypothetical protein